MHFYFIQGVPVLILANKQDLPGAREPKQLEKLLGLHELSPLCPQTSINISNSNATNTTSSGTVGPTITSTCGSSQPQSQHHSQGLTPQQHSFKGWYIQPACAITGEGLQEGLEQLYDMIIKKRKMNKAIKKKR